MGIVKLIPEFVIKEVPLITYLRKELRDPDLIMFQSTRNGVWCLAHWVDKVQGFVNCIETLGVDYMARVNRNFIDSLRRARNPMDADKLKKNILKAHNRDLEAEDERLAQTNEHWNWLKKRIGDKAPVPYSFTSTIRRK